LNLKISKDNFLEAEPIVSDEFPFAYGGAKATYGFTEGKIFFEVKYVKNLDVRADFGDLESKHVLRVGWSDLHTDLQLGEEIIWPRL
jgi:heterogeneous nuclear ribonucleoprotein U-like protein 1